MTAIRREDGDPRVGSPSISTIAVGRSGSALPTLGA
jgi:hypothetical protein